MSQGMRLFLNATWLTTGAWEKMLVLVLGLRKSAQRIDYAINVSMDTSDYVTGFADPAVAGDLLSSQNN